jgi:hypothetical protein
MSQVYSRVSMCLASLSFWGLSSFVACEAGGQDGTHDADGGEIFNADAGSDVADSLTCAEEHARDWTVSAAPACAGGRTCIDDRGRWWVHGAPFIARGLYNAGFEFQRVLDNCAAGEPCEATTPTDLNAYLDQMAAGGFNLIQERSRNVADMRAAVNAHPDIYFAHLLWSDPFTEEGHGALVEEIEAAAEDPDVIMWFGPDEVDMWDDWSTAAGIRRILRGASTQLDVGLASVWAPEGEPYLPADQPAHDPYNLPYGAALDATLALEEGTYVYEALMPTIYPLTGSDSELDGAYWGTERVSTASSVGETVLPVLQMVGISSMGLSQPSPSQLKALIASSMVHGARGAFYYTYISDQPHTAGRTGWYAPDDVAAFAAYTSMHGLQDELVPVFFSDAEEEAITTGGVEWRRYNLGDRSVALVVNARAEAVEVYVEDLLPGANIIRRYQTCEIMSEGILNLRGYEVTVLEGF